MDNLLVAAGQRRVLRHGSLSVDFDARILRCGTTVVAASNAEFDLLALLLVRRNLPLSKAVILAELFGHGSGRDPRQVDVFIARLRRALEPYGLACIIATVPGRGYAVLDEPLTEHQLSRPRPCDVREATIAA